MLMSGMKRPNLSLLLALRWSAAWTYTKRWWWTCKARVQTAPCTPALTPDPQPPSSILLDSRCPRRPSTSAQDVQRISKVLQLNGNISSLSFSPPTKPLSSWFLFSSFLAWLVETRQPGGSFAASRAGCSTLGLKDIHCLLARERGVMGAGCRQGAIVRRVGLFIMHPPGFFLFW